MTIGLDTSVVVRLLIGLPEREFAAARRRIESARRDGDPILVCDLVIAEAYHALRHHYGVPDHEARRRLGELASSGLVVVEPAGGARALGGDPAPTARSEHAPTPSVLGGAGVVDHLIHARYRSLDAMTLTFDRAQASLEGASTLRG